jgi:hypothetical protein
MTRTEKGGVIAGLPLALLESVRAHDRPGEILEDEDLTISLPRRLGLKGVVLSQIQRYEEAHAAKKKVPVSDLMNLLQLVLRRPDAEAILRDTGQRVARFRYDRLPRPFAGMLRTVPQALAFVAVRRAARGMMRNIAGSRVARVDGKPLVVRLTDSPAARLDPKACVLYTGALEELALLYSGKARTIEHSRCLARGDDVCEWTAE